MLANRAQTERLVLSKRVKDGRYQRALMGQVTGKAPFGYHKVNRKLEIHPEQEFILKQIFFLYLKYKCLTTVANLLNEQRPQQSRLMSRGFDKSKCMIHPCGMHNQDGWTVYTLTARVS